MSKLKKFLMELSKSLDDIEAARKISGVNDEEIRNAYLHPLQEKCRLGSTFFTSSGGQLIIHMSRIYGSPTIEITAKDVVELAKFLQKKGIRPYSLYDLHIASGEFDDEKNTIRIGIPGPGKTSDWFYFRPGRGGTVEIPYNCLKNPLTYEIAEYIENNIVERKSILSCLAR